MKVLETSLIVMSLLVGISTADNVLMPPIPYHLDDSTCSGSEDCESERNRLKNLDGTKQMKEGFCSFVCEDSTGDACTYRRSEKLREFGLSSDDSCDETPFPCVWGLNSNNAWGWICGEETENFNSTANYTCSLEVESDSTYCYELERVQLSFLRDPLYYRTRVTGEGKKKYLWIITKYSKDNKKAKRYPASGDGFSKDDDYECKFKSKVDGWICDSAQRV